MLKDLPTAPLPPNYCKKKTKEALQNPKHLFKMSNAIFVDINEVSLSVYEDSKRMYNYMVLSVKCRVIEMDFGQAVLGYGSCFWQIKIEFIFPFKNS